MRSSDRRGPATLLEPVDRRAARAGAGVKLRGASDRMEEDAAAEDADRGADEGRGDCAGAAVDLGLCGAEEDAPELGVNETGDWSDCRVRAWRASTRDGVGVKLGGTPPAVAGAVGWVDDADDAARTTGA